MAAPDRTTARVIIVASCGHCRGTGYCVRSRCAECAAHREATESAECGVCSGTSVHEIPVRPEPVASSGLVSQAPDTS